MRTENLVLVTLQKKVKGLQCGESFIKGIAEYVRDNNISALVDDSESSEKSTFFLEMFMEPIIKMPPEVVAAYFSNYSLIKEFKILSNTVFDLAVRKYKNSEDMCIADIENKVVECITKIYSNAELKSRMESDISEVLLDIDYLKGISDQYSLRLAKAVR